MDIVLAAVASPRPGRSARTLSTLTVGHSLHVPPPSEDSKIKIDPCLRDFLNPRALIPYMAMEMIEVVVEFETNALGLSQPPVAVDITMRPGASTCDLTARAERDEHVDPVFRWLSDSGAKRVEKVERRGVAAHLSHLPSICGAFTEGGSMREVRLRPNTPARAMLQGDRQELLPVVGRLREEGTILNVRKVARMAADVPLLTGGQFEALSLAAQCGYYEIPRPLNLHELAGRMGASTAAVSERLRRAEARVIVHYLRHEGGLLSGSRDPR